VVVEAPAAAVVVVVEAVGFVVVVVDPEASLWLFEDFLEAEGLEDPQAAAISPAAMTTPAIRSDAARGRRARSAVVLSESVLVGTVVRPHSCCLRAAGPRTPPPSRVISPSRAADSRPKTSTMSNTWIRAISSQYASR
jgi:hypothetical protein